MHINNYKILIFFNNYKKIILFSSSDCEEEIDSDVQDAIFAQFYFQDQPVVKRSGKYCRCKKITVDVKKRTVDVKKRTVDVKNVL